MATEVWKILPNFTGYEISSLGNVRTYRSINGKGKLKALPRIVTPTRMPKKVYLRVNLRTDEGLSVHRPLHQLVLEAFKGLKPFPEAQGRHLDGNPDNCRIDNLEWGTVQENANDRIKHGTQVRGEKVSNSKLTSAQVTEIQLHIPYWKKGDGRHFANKFGVGDSTISAIKNGQTWSNNGNS